MIFFANSYLVSELSVVSVVLKVVIFHGFPAECPVVLGETTRKVVFVLLWFFFKKKQPDC